MNAQQLQALITDCLARLDANINPICAKFNRPEAVQLLFGTACAESDCGHYIEQTNGPALGIYQMEPKTHDDIWRNYINHRPQLLKFMRGEIGETLLAVKSDSLRWNLRYATLMARLHYYRVAEKIPTTTPPELAGYWKRHYNTVVGRGRMEDFLIKTRKYNV